MPIDVIAKIPSQQIRSFQCPGCGDAVTAPRQKTVAHVLGDSEQRAWHVGCALVALGDVPMCASD